MIVRIDGRVITDHDVQGDNLEEILKSLQQDHVPSGRTIVEVIVNGKTYSEEMPHAAIETERTAIQSLDLVTLSSSEMAVHFIENGRAMTAAIHDFVPQIVELFRLGDEAEGNEYFLRFLNSLQLLVKTLTEVASMFPGFSGLEIRGTGSLSDILQEMEHHLDLMLNRQQVEDWSGLADRLELGLRPVLAGLRDAFPTLETWIKARAQG